MFKQISLLAAAAVLSLGTAASAATIFFDDFDTEFGVPVNTVTKPLANWSITSGSVDVVGDGSSFPWCGVGRCLDMNGNSQGRIETTLTGLTAGKKYFLTFDFGNNQNSQNANVPEVLSFGFVNQVFSLDIFAQGSLTSSAIYELIAGSDEETLFFADTGTTSTGDRGGPLLDNVKVSAVPLPAGGLLLLGALGGIAALRRRKTV